MHAHLQARAFCSIHATARSCRVQGNHGVSRDDTVSCASAAPFWRARLRACAQRWCAETPGQTGLCFSMLPHPWWSEFSSSVQVRPPCRPSTRCGAGILRGAHARRRGAVAALSAPAPLQEIPGGGARARAAADPAAHFYADHAVETQLGRRAVEIDRAARTVRLDDGTVLPYDKLLLATGSQPRALTVPGAEPRRRAHPAQRSRTWRRSAPSSRRTPAGHRRRRLHRAGSRRDRARAGARRHGAGDGGPGDEPGDCPEISAFYRGRAHETRGAHRLQRPRARAGRQRIEAGCARWSAKTARSTRRMWCSSASA